MYLAWSWTFLENNKKPPPTVTLDQGQFVVCYIPRFAVRLIVPMCISVGASPKETITPVLLASPLSKKRWQHCGSVLRISVLQQESFAL